MLAPFDYEIPSGDATSGVVGSLAKSITNWISNQRPATTNGRLTFDISVYSSSKERKLPIYRLGDLRLVSVAKLTGYCIKSL
jgi:hypothetical protein